MGICINWDIREALGRERFLRVCDVARVLCERWPEFSNQFASIDDSGLEFTITDEEITVNVQRTRQFEGELTAKHLEFRCVS